MNLIEKSEIVLSITIPTLNRRHLLEKTLQYLIEQVDQALVSIELIVSDNASDDGTSTLFGKDGPFENFVQYVHFDQRVDIDTSFARSVQLSRGRYIILFGDDDIPLPGFIREVTRAIHLYSDTSLLYVNRIIGDMNLFNTTDVPHADTPYGLERMPISVFIKKFTHWPGFITCLIFSAEAWNNGSSEINEYEGFNFLNRIYAGSVNREACYIASPLVLQRRGIQSWKKHWPKYWLISIPKLLKNLEQKGITSGAVDTWRKHEVTTLRFIIDCFVAKAYNYSWSSSFWHESRSYQTSKVRIFFSLVVQLLIPRVLATFLYSKTNKMT